MDNEYFIEKQIDNDINYNDFEIDDDEKDMSNLTTLINCFNIFYNKKYNTTGSLFSNIDLLNNSSTNLKLYMFYEQLNDYNKNKYDISNTIILKFKLIIKYEKNIETYYCNNVIPLLLKVLALDNYLTIDWNII